MEIWQRRHHRDPALVVEHVTRRFEILFYCRDRVGGIHFLTDKTFLGCEKFCVGFNGKKRLSSIVILDNVVSAVLLSELSKRVSAIFSLQATLYCSRKRLRYSMSTIIGSLKLSSARLSKKYLTGLFLYPFKVGSRRCISCLMKGRNGL
jgi:hypothetical protein